MISASSLRPPPELRAGRLTATFLGSATHVVDETEKLAGQLGGASAAVVSARDQYLKVDEATEEALRPMEEKEREYERYRKEMEKQGLDPDGPV